MTDLLKTSDLCEQLSVTRQTIHKWRLDGLPVAFQKGRVIRYNFNEVLNWLQIHKTERSITKNG
jgi:predicted site-specific integrase-resolvase|tara:strand:+ start:481 stop:672 length:192 start_codon:yes stop_codon:yes gene_type:complete